jgi:hypothetical protein
MNLNIQPFIFNWKNQFEKTSKIESSLKNIFDKVTVINSDDDNSKDNWIDIGNDAYFTEQFMTAVNMFDGDIFFHIQGDISFDNWEELVSSAIKYFEEYNYGIYAPNVDYTWYDSNVADLKSIEFENYPNLKVVSNPDCTIWFIHKDIIDRLKNNPFDLSFNKMGWGLDLILCANCFINKRLVIRDYNFTVDHPQGTGYGKEQAGAEMVELISKCSKEIQTAIHYIRFNKEQLSNYFRS